jgi:hypothetical protein
MTERTFKTAPYLNHKNFETTFFDLCADELIGAATKIAKQWSNHKLSYQSIAVRRKNMYRSLAALEG